MEMVAVIAKIGGGRKARTRKWLQQENQKLTLHHPQPNVETGVQAEIRCGRRMILSATDAKHGTVNGAVGVLNEKIRVKLDVLVEVDTKNLEKDLGAVVEAKNPKIKRRNKN